jgi:predicted Zn-dependent protease
MLNLSVKYHDGRLSIAHDATLTLMPDYWLIHYVDPDGELQSVRWDLDLVTADPHFTTLYIFRYGGFPQQTIESKEQDLPSLLKEKYPSRIFFKRSVAGIFGTNNAFLIGLAALAVLILGCCYWFVLPYFAEKVASNFPQDMEVQLGNSLYDNVIEGYDVNDTLTAQVNDFAKAIDFQTSYPIKVTVVKEDQTNAFALPGGHIVIFEKILQGMRTKEELAALLAHEVAHVHYRHSLKSMFRSLAGYLFISLLLSDINNIVAVLADNSNMLVNLTYSRDLETEADHKAMATLESSGISLKGFVDLFQLLESQAEASVSPKILSSHPLTADRIQYAKAAAREQSNILDQSALQHEWKKLRLKLSSER